MTEVVLEPAAQAFADATATPPDLFDLSIEEGRRTVDSVQDGDVRAPAVDVTDLTVTGGPHGPGRGVPPGRPARRRPRSVITDHTREHP